RLREHTERLVNSARIMGFEIPYTAEQIDAASDQVLAANGLADAYVRPIAWRGSEMLAVGAQDTRDQPPVPARPWPSYFGVDRMVGIRMDMAHWKRPSPETAPTAAKATGLYMIGTLAKHRAEQQGYADALMLDWRGNVAETTSANVFFVMDGELH